jgi:ATP phosphoribosyltransferase regulatory subunit HisZ
VPPLRYGKTAELPGIGLTVLLAIYNGGLKMQREKHEVLVAKDNREAIVKVREIVEKINGMKTPEYENEHHVRFEYFGTMLDGLECMGAGAAMVA